MYRGQIGVHESEGESDIICVCAVFYANCARDGCAAQVTTSLGYTLKIVLFEKERERDSGRVCCLCTIQEKTVGK